MSVKPLASIDGKALDTPLLVPLWLLVVVSALGPLVMNGVLPANTTIMRELVTDYGVVQLILTVYLFANMVSQIVLGSLSDRFGRRPVMLVSLLIFALGSFWCAWAGSIESLLSGRFVQGFGAAACVILPRTIVRDMYPRDRSASVIGYMTTAMMVAPLFGPALGGWVTDVSSWRFMYSGLGVIGLLVCGLCSLFLRETRVQTAVSGPALTFVGSARRLLSTREFNALVLIVCGSVGVYYAFLGGAPYVVMELLGNSATDYGRYFIFVAVGYLSGNFLAGKFSVRFGTDRMIVLAMLPFALGIVLFWLLSLWQHPFGMFFPMFFIALSNGACLPNLMSAMMSVHPEIAGAASGLGGTLMTGIGIVFTLLLTLFLRDSALVLYIVMTSAALMAGSGFLLFRK